MGPGPHTNHTQTSISQRDPLLIREEKLKWLLSDSGRKIGAKDLADVVFKEGEKGGLSVLDWARMSWYILVAHGNQRELLIARL